MLEPTDQTSAEVSTESEKCLFTLLLVTKLKYRISYRLFKFLPSMQDINITSDFCSPFLPKVIFLLFTFPTKKKPSLNEIPFLMSKIRRKIPHNLHLTLIHK